MLMINASPWACNLRASVYQVHELSGLCHESQPTANTVFVKLESCEEMKQLSALFLQEACDQENVRPE